MNIAFERLGNVRLQLGESPVWDERRGLVFLVDIRGKAVHALQPDGSGLRTWAMPSMPGSVGLGESGRLVVALEREIAVLDPDSGSLEPVASLPDVPVQGRLNDGKVGPDGAFYVGSMDNRPPDERQPVGSLYRIDGKGHASVVAQGGLVTSNGLAWSADGLTMFQSDSHARWIDRADFDPASGQISNRIRMAADIGADVGRPDGAACDVAGNYLSAGVSAGRLNLWSCDGTMLRSFPVPAPAPTMPCFCGPDLRTLVVTTLQPGPDRQASPLSGAVFIARVPFAGAKVHRWKDA